MSEILSPARTPAAAEAPAPPPALSAEKTSLESLVHHRGAVPWDMPLEEVHKVFREKDVEFLALIRDDQVTGLCSRSHLGFLLGSRYGFALYSKSPAHHAQVKSPLVFTTGTPVREVLDRALARHGDDFYEDVALVDPELRLRGMIPVEALAHLQSRLVAEQLGELRRRNLELFQASHAQRQAEGLYQGLFDSDALGVALLDPRGVIQSHNRRLAELLEFGAATGEQPQLAQWISERERPVFLEALAAHEHQGRASLTREYHVEIPGRGSRLFRFYTGWIRETGQICACVDDITEQRAIEGHVQRQEKQLLLDTLVGGIAHELNNKLTPVMGFADMLTSGDSKLVPRYAGYIAKSADEAATIIKQLLQLSKPESGNRQNIDLRSVVDESLMMLKFKLRESRAHLRSDMPAAPVGAFADASQIKQVVINLILNALHAMEEAAAPILSIAVGTRGDQSYLRVTDNGTGIAPEIMARIFDPFFTTKSPDRGSGLGLSVCYSIVRQHGGDIVAESESGRGARFTVLLPPARNELVAGPADAPVAAHGAPPAPGAEPRRRVLVVEDEEVVSKLLQEVLRAAFDCSVDLAANGAEGLRCAEQGDYALIVSDVRMPEMNGAEFYQRLKELKPALARRLVFVTGHAGDKVLEHELARWNVAVVAKPFTPRRLIEVCRPVILAVNGDRAH